MATTPINLQPPHTPSSRAHLRHVHVAREENDARARVAGEEGEEAREGLRVQRRPRLYEAVVARCDLQGEGREPGLRGLWECTCCRDAPGYPMR